LPSSFSPPPGKDFCTWAVIPRTPKLAYVLVAVICGKHKKDMYGVVEKIFTIEDQLEAAAANHSNKVCFVFLFPPFFCKHMKS
jgi:hypothetical protein